MRYRHKGNIVAFISCSSIATLHLINRNSICGQLHTRTHYRRIDCAQHTMKRMNTREEEEGKREVN